MAAVCEDRSFSLLPSVLDLLLHNADSIIDDTSLEKLLAWLSEVSSQPKGMESLTGTLQFLESDKLFDSPSSLAFGLRLCGIFWRREEDFIKLKYLVHLFKRSIQDFSLWGEPVVRNAWFVGLQSLCGHREGNHWLKTFDECVSVAVNHVCDISMFVAMAARTFAANLLIVCYTNISPDEKPGASESDGNHSSADIAPPELFGSHSCATMLLEKLNIKLHVEEKNPMRTQGCSDNRIAVVDITRILLNTNPIVGQKVLRVSRLFTLFLQLVKTADEAFCDKFVDLISEMVTNTQRWNLDWGVLLLMEHQASHNGDLLPATLVLEIPLLLLQRGFITIAFNAIAGLAFAEEALPSCFPMHWYNCLYFLLDTCVAGLCRAEQQTVNHSCNGDTTSLSKSTVDQSTDIIFITETDSAKNKETEMAVELMLRPWLTKQNTHIKVLSLVLSTVEDLATKVPIAAKISKWTKLTLNILRACASTEGDTQRDTLDLPSGIYMDKKLLKTCLSTIHVLMKVKVEMQGEIIPIFNDAMRLLVLLLKSSQTEATIITAVLKTLGNLLQISPPHTTVLLRATAHAPSEDTGSPSANKRPKQDISLTRDSFASELGFVLHRRLRDERWEVKDSVLEFVTCLLHIQEDSIVQFLADHNIPSVVWQALDDHESYVRASAWQAIGRIMCSSHLRAHMVQTSHIQAEQALKKIVSVIKNDSEAFPRRRAIECITIWIQHRVPALSCILPRMGISAATGTVDSGALSVISRALTCAMKDFDWEVKLRALELIGTIIEMFEEANNESKSLSDMVVADNYNTTEDNSGVLAVLFDLGVLRPLLEAVDDCDSLVCEKALAVVGLLQRGVAKPETLTNTVLQQTEVRPSDIKGKSPITTIDEDPITTIDELGNVLAADLETNEQFEDILQRLDVVCLSTDSACADIKVRSEPACMLEDILSAAGDHDENLLDCY